MQSNVVTSELLGQVLTSPYLVVLVNGHLTTGNKPPLASHVTAGGASSTFAGNGGLTLVFAIASVPSDTYFSYILA